MTGDARGLTLLELVVATAIFALVAVMALQAMTGGLIQRRVIEAADADQAGLMRALALLRQDLDSAVPLPHLPAAGPAGAPLEVPPAGGFALSRAGLPGLDDPAGPGLARVVWRVDAGEGRLMRQVRPLVGGSDAAAGDHAVLAGVTGLRLTARGDWPDAPAGLPAGFEVVIDTRRWGSLRLVVAR